MGTSARVPLERKRVRGRGVRRPARDAAIRRNGCPWDEQTCLDAAREGHLRVLEWALREGAPNGIWSASDDE